jgi:hypothetical protein
MQENQMEARLYTTINNIIDLQIRVSELERLVEREHLLRGRMNGRCCDCYKHLFFLMASCFLAYYLVFVLGFRV